MRDEVILIFLVFICLGLGVEIEDVSTRDFCWRRPSEVSIKRDEFFVIHVGKTGGTSVVASVSKAFHLGKDFHLCEPTMNEIGDRPVLMTIREPIARVQSIWRWRKYQTTVLDHTAFGKSEKTLFRCFPYLNDFLEARGKFGNFTNTSISNSICRQFAEHSFAATPHWQWDHQRYLRNFTDDFIQSYLFPLRQTNLLEDFLAFCKYFSLDKRKCFEGMEGLVFEHQNEEYPTKPNDFYLSDEAREFLAFELQDDISTYNYLVDILHAKVRTMKNAWQPMNFTRPLPNATPIWPVRPMISGPKRPPPKKPPLSPSFSVHNGIAPRKFVSPFKSKKVLHHQ